MKLQPEFFQNIHFFIYFASKIQNWPHKVQIFPLQLARESIGIDLGLLGFFGIF